MGKTNEEKVLTDEEDSSFERIEEDSQLETSEGEEEREEETFEVVQDELVQARTEIDRLKKRINGLARSTLCAFGCGFILLAMARMTPAASPTCPQCPAPSCPSDSSATRQLKFSSKSGSDFGFTIKESFVTDVDAHSPAFVAGLRWGDEIEYVNGYRVGNLDEETLNKTIHERYDRVSLAVRSNNNGLAKMEAAKQRAYNQGHSAGFWDAVRLLLVVFGLTYLYSRLIDALEARMHREENKKAVDVEVIENEPEVKEVVEEEEKEEKKALEMEEIIERACKIIRAELNATKEKNVEKMKSSAHVDELVRSWLANTLDENFGPESNSDLLKL